MVKSREELLQQYRDTRKELLSAIDGLSDEQMIDPSLDGWSIKDHLAHIAFWDDLRAAEVVRISAGHESVWKLPSEQDEALNALAYTVRRAMSLEQARWELDASRQSLLDAISSATPRGLDTELYGEAGLYSTHEAQHAEWIQRWRAEREI